MAATTPVTDWATDFDVLDPSYVEDPFRIWKDLRKTCPIAHTDRRGSNWLPDPVRRRHRDSPRHRALQLAQGGGDPLPGGRTGTGRPRARARPAPDLRRSASPHLDPPAAAALVLAQPRGDGTSRSLASCAGSSWTVSQDPAAPTPPSSTPSRSRSA